MTDLHIFVLQWMLSFIVYALIAAWYVSPYLAKLPLHSALMPLVFVHTIRHLGLMILVTVATDPTMPRSFTVPLAYGDMAAQLLALASVFALRYRWSFAIPLVWIFNIVGMLDLLVATFNSFRYDSTSYQLGSVWYIPTFIVPALFVTHIMMFAMLIQRGGERG